MSSIVLIAHNLRSAHNVGSLLRTAEGLGITCVYLTGYTPHPATHEDSRLPHEALKTTRSISKTALGAETSQNWKFSADISEVLSTLRADGYEISAVEQADQSVALPDFVPPPKLALIVGREVEGVEGEVLEQCNTIIEIPMHGKKESYNVVQAAAMAMYHCRYPGATQK